MDLQKAIVKLKNIQLPTLPNINIMPYFAYTVGGVPVLTYGMIAITTVVLATATIYDDHSSSSNDNKLSSYLPKMPNFGFTSTPNPTSPGFFSGLGTSLGFDETNKSANKDSFFPSLESNTEPKSPGILSGLGLGSSEPAKEKDSFLPNLGMGSSEPTKEKESFLPNLGFNSNTSQAAEPAKEKESFLPNLGFESKPENKPTSGGKKKTRRQNPTNHKTRRHKVKN